MTYFDTHAHLDDERFAGDLEQVFGRMRDAGVGLCVTVGASLPTSRAARALAEGREGLYFAAGVHPHDAADWRSGDAGRIAQLLAHPKGVAWGEIGLDYHYDLSPRTDQRSVFEEQLNAAYELGKPVILHIRDAHGDALAMLGERRASLPPMVVHCYSGSWESAKLYMDLGCMISFTGTVTFKNARKLHEVAKLMPLDRLMIETDCPYLAPEPMRGRRNEPTWVVYVARQIAALRGISGEEVRDATTRNAKAFFNIA